jgi:hypothetical protein
MTTSEIAAEEARLKSIEMSPARWEGEYKLKEAKAACAEYKSATQEKTFQEWLKDLMTASRETGAFDEENGGEESRSAYYEGQSEIWVDAYDDGESAEDAVAEDMSYWDD